MKDLAKRAKEASRKLVLIEKETKDQIFDELVKNLSENKEKIIQQNALDLKAAKESDLSEAMIDRLSLTSERIDQMIEGVRAIKAQPEVVGTFFGEFKNEIGLSIKKQRVPLGVILMIFESRPNVVIDCAALAIKSSNSIILKGGKEAKHSNDILGNIIKISLEKYVSSDCVQVLASDNREHVKELLSYNEFIDVVIPRGGHKLIEYVSETAKMPVIAHFQGLCHMFIDESANIQNAINLVINAKTQRPGVCNAIETLIVHEKIFPKIAPMLSKALSEKNTELRVDSKATTFIKENTIAASEEDWSTEYLDNILSIKTVSNLDEAILHIEKYGSHHSECIISEDQKNCEKFLRAVDASCVMVNASTRFNDGSQLGLGAELGISTTKLHAYGPMGAEQMTTARYVVTGQGQIRG